MREGRERFGDDPGNYDAARPRYPDRVWEILAERCGLRERATIFEVGPGTGTATRELVARGAEVTAIEPDARLAAFLAKRQDAVVVKIETFEGVRLRAESFDLGVAATSFHWVENQRRGLSKAYRLLKPGGAWAMWWNIFGNPLGEDAFHEATGRLMTERTGVDQASGQGWFPLEAEARTADLEEAGFVDVRHEVIRFTHRSSPEETRALYATFSNVTRLPEAERASLLDEIARVAREEFGGVVERPMLTSVYTCRRA
jgi:SAM-dependent methyltransferase